MKVGIIGYGELGGQLKGFVASNQLDIKVYYFDDIALDNHVKNSISLHEYSNDEYKNFSFIIGLGYKHLMFKNQIVDELISMNRTMLKFIHQSSFVNPSAKVADGTFIYPCCNIDKDVEIEAGVIINNSCVISHNSIIGRASYLSPGVILSGNVTIGARVFIGAGSVISNNVTINNDAVIGIGSVITKDVLSGQCVIGNPMKVLKKKINLI